MRFALLAFLLAGAEAPAQTGGGLGLWAQYSGTFRASDLPVGLIAEVQARGHRVGRDLDQIVARVGGQARLPARLTVTQGYGYVYSEPAGDAAGSTTEHRLFQDVGGSRNVGTVKLSPRVRFEERWVEGEAFQTRLRVTLGAAIPLTGDAVRRGSIYSAGSAELFLRGPVRGDRPVYDRTRLYGGLGVRTTGGLGVQAGLLAQVYEGATDLQVQLSLHHAVTF